MMYKVFRNIGLITILLLSFIYTERLANVVKEYDEIMIEIQKNFNKKEPIEAKIENNTFIPGLNGRKIDIDRSYKKMKKIGKYSNNLLIYEKIPVKEKIKNNYDKFIISGNKKKKQVSIIVLNNLNIDDKNINIFLDIKTMKNNEQKIITMKNTFGNINSNNLVFLKSLTNQKNNYCYTENYDIEILKKCTRQKFYTIVPNIIFNNDLNELSTDLENGSIITIKNIKYLKSIINLIKNKGYDIVSLEKLLEE